jgi:hypothetical protein
MNNPAYTWIKSVNAEHPVNKVKSDKYRKCRLSLFFPFETQRTFFGALRPSFISFGRRRENPLPTKLRVCLVLPHVDARNNARWSKTGGSY